MRLLGVSLVLLRYRVDAWYFNPSPLCAICRRLPHSRLMLCCLTCFRLSAPFQCGTCAALLQFGFLRLVWWLRHLRWGL